jgi:uncharacterized membrane protein
MLVVVAVMFNTVQVVAVLVALVVVAMAHLAKAILHRTAQTLFQIQVVAVVEHFTMLRLLQHSQQDEKVEAAAE